MKIAYKLKMRLNKIIYKFLSIICISVFPHLFSLHGDFVFDDSEAILKNKDVINNSWTDSFYNDFWGTNITSDLSHKSYRPLTILSFRLNYLLSGRQLVAYHFKITNLFCHVFCSILAWQAFSRIFRTGNQIWLDEAYIAGLLFAVHPLHVEAVAGIVGRADILAAITFFLAFLTYDKSVNSKKWTDLLYLAISIVISGISMLFKEYGITVLSFCLLYECLTKIKVKASVNGRNNLILIGSASRIRIAWIIIALCLLLYSRWTVMGGTKPTFKPIDNPAAFDECIFTKIASHNYIYFLNLLLLTWPQWLCYDWSMGCVPLIRSFGDYRIIFVVLIYLYGLMMLRTFNNIKNWKNNRRNIVLAVSLMVIPFLPASNIILPVGFVIAERVLYISSAGYCLLVAIGFKMIMRRISCSKVLLSLFFVTLLTFALRSWQRSLDWRTEYSLFTSGLSVCPLNAKVRYNVAKVADAKHNTAWALDEYATAIRLYPDYYQAMNNLANLLRNQGQYEESEFYLRKAISLKEDFPAAWMNLGIVLANTKRFKESLDAYKKALSHRRNYPDCIYNLGNLYLEVNDTQSAMDSWFEAIRLSPQHSLAWTNLIALLTNTGQFQKAIEVIPRALEVLPDSPSVNFAIANVYGKMDKYRDAEGHFLKAIELFDNKVQAIHYANLGVLYQRWKKYTLAREMYQKSLNIDPEFKSAYMNLQSVLKHLKNK